VNSVPVLLANNPYSQILSYSGTPIGNFYVDSQKKIVNKYQKPLCLMLQLLQMFVAPESLVIDATCGSGSLEIAALEPEAPPGLKFISFDFNDYQVKNATERWKATCGAVCSEDDQLPLDCRFERHNC
jgi:DNA modification methylase